MIWSKKKFKYSISLKILIITQKFYIKILQLTNQPFSFFLTLTTTYLFIPLQLPTYNKQQKILIPKTINSKLQHLFNLDDPNQNITFDPHLILTILKFIKNPKNNTTLYHTDGMQDLTSTYYNFNIHQDLKTIITYTFNPNIPKITTTPSSTHLSNSINSKKNTRPPFQINRYLNELETPAIFKKHQYIKITPNLNSNTYYKYNLNQTLLLFKYHQHDVLIIISKQTNISTINKKNYVLNSNNN